MPWAPARPCRVPGCPALVKGGGFCTRHLDRDTRRSFDEERGSAAARGYDRRWQRIRATFLAGNPLCVFCRDSGRTTPATDVDHVVPRRSIQRMFEELGLEFLRGRFGLPDAGTWPAIADHPSNLRALCHACHSQRTARDVHAAQRAADGEPR